jgi:long-chain acyl-CoA synthetase
MDPSVHIGERSRGTSDIEARARRAAAGFAAAGVRAGDAVALLLRNDFPFLEAGAGAALLGAYAVPLNWHFAKAEIDYVLHDCDAKVLVVHADLLRLVDVTALRSEGRTVVVVPTERGLQDAYGLATAECEPPPELPRWDSWLAVHAPWQGTPGTPVESVIYTSGTTGRPKGVKRSPPTPQQAQRIEQMRAKVYGLVPGIRLIVPAPLYHAAPNVFASRGMRVAERLVLMEKFDAEDLLRQIETHRATTIVMVPTMFVRLLRLPQAVRERYDLSSLRAVYHAAAPCPPEVKAEMIAWWGPIINEWYGTTESSVVTWCDSAQWLAHRGTVGRPIEGARVEIVSDDGQLLPPGQAGEVYVGLDFYPDFTFHKREEERRRIGRNGLITGGDVGYLDEDGYLYICDRKRDMIISGGVNIYPAEIEAAILESPEIQDCAVFGVPDAEYGESVLALVVRAPNAAESGIRERLRSRLEQRLARYKIPRTIETRDALPRDDAGKLIKRSLREPYWKDAQRRI